MLRINLHAAVVDAVGSPAPHMLVAAALPERACPTIDRLVNHSWAYTIQRLNQSCTPAASLPHLVDLDLQANPSKCTKRKQPRARIEFRVWERGRVFKRDRQQRAPETGTDAAELLRTESPWTLQVPNAKTTQNRYMTIIT